MGAIIRPGFDGIISGVNFPLTPFERRLAIRPIGSSCCSNFSLTPRETINPAPIRCWKISPQLTAMLSRHNRMFLRCSERKAQNEYFIHFPRRHLSHHQSPFRGLAMIHLAMVHLRMLRLLCVPFQPRIWPSQLQLLLLLSLSQQ